MSCKIMCFEEEGQTLNPVDGCSCISIEEEKALYPEWANAKDRDYAMRLGQQEIDNKRREIRPFDGDKKFDGGESREKRTKKEENEDSLMDDIMEAIHVIDSATYAASASLSVATLATLMALQ